MNNMTRIPSQQGDHCAFDVLVIGSGSAGLSFCLELSQLQPQTRIALITKMALPDSNSYYAQGGIATVAKSEDSFTAHAQDTFNAGDSWGDIRTIETMIKTAPHTITFLQQVGVNFDRDENNAPVLAQEGGHSQRRIFHCGDQTGKTIVEALTQRVRELKNIEIFEFHSVVNLITVNNRQPGSNIEVIGAYVLSEKTLLISSFLAKAVILATGGAGKTYRYTTNPDTATGDGIAMAYRAGARVSNMEFYQFHPTLLYHPTLNNFLISEAVRGEGAYLRLPHSGERFMQRYAPDKMELATRDIVARAIFTEIERLNCHFVYLDITHHPAAFLKKRFPNIFTTLLQIGIDMSKEQIPVVPAAHYLCGGVLCDLNGQTDLKRLYAIGETACTGFHGANRLASNSLLECVTMARLAAQDCCKWLAEPLPASHKIQRWNSQCVVDFRRASQISANWRSLRGEMTSYAGIVRTEAGLKDLLQLLHMRREIIENYYWQYSITRDLIELRNISLIAELIARSALHRRESRGCHYREDFPKKLLNSEETILREQYSIGDKIT